jgi:hypothetical protein
MDFLRGALSVPFRISGGLLSFRQTYSRRLFFLRRFGFFLNKEQKRKRSGLTNGGVFVCLLINGADF